MSETSLSWGEVKSAAGSIRVIHNSWGASGLVVEHSPELLQRHLRYPGNRPVLAPILSGAREQEDIAIFEFLTSAATGASAVLLDVLGCADTRFKAAGFRLSRQVFKT